MGWDAIRGAIVEILKEATPYKNDTRNEPCFLSAYQIAVLLYKDNKSLILSSTCPNNIGGKGDGKHTSLSQYIAQNLSREVDQGDMEIERAFFNTAGLSEFLFLDEKGIIKEPSDPCFSMFRYKFIIPSSINEDRKV